MLKMEESSVNSRLDKLEKISNQISLLISSGDYDKINHLDKMRKKIITDMNEKYYQFNQNNKQTVLKLISKNEEIITQFKNKEEDALSDLVNKKKCTQAYLATF
tara:strand:+ start:206 stop:517 length:312 start_codon:yes stop_codon:yes gene_type:complete